jgi:Flp pilus assembly protein TadG
MNTIWTTLQRVFSDFRRANGANVAITFALATIPVIGCVGAAVDYSRGNSVRADLQASLDSAALMLSREASSDTSNQLQTNALKYVSANFNRPGTTISSVSATYTTTGGTQIVLNGSVVVPTDFMKMVGVSTINVTGTSTVKWGSSRLRVALVLDNTGSMADDGKIGALKTATASLLTQLQGAASNDGDVYVSIIPFVKDVNLGAANYSSDYLYWGTSAQDPSLTDNNSWDANNGRCSTGSYSTRSSCTSHSSCSISGYNSQNSCTNAGTCSLSGYSSQSNCTGAGTCSISGRSSQSSCTAGSCSISGYSSQSSCTGAGTCSISGHSSQSSCTSAGVCSRSQYTSSSSCSQHSGTWTTGRWTSGTWTAGGTWTTGSWTPGVWSAYTWTPDNHSTWNGCVVDRGNSTAPDSGNYDANVTEPSTSINATLYATEQYSTCPQAAMGLSYSWSSMSTLVSNMSPNGNTNQAIGLQLGWMSLVGGGPFTSPAMDPNYQYKQIIILLTDGLNTQDRWYTSQSSIDAREQLTCNNIKAAGITLYTIQVNTGGDPTSTLLQNCATDSTKFYLLTSASQILTTFNSIGTNLSQLYVAK